MRPTTMDVVNAYNKAKVEIEKKKLELISFLSDSVVEKGSDEWYEFMESIEEL